MRQLFILTLFSLLLSLPMTGLTAAPPNRLETIAVAGFVNKIPPGTIVGNLDRGLSGAQTVMSSRLMQGRKLGVMNMAANANINRVAAINSLLNQGDISKFANSTRADYLLCGSINSLSLRSSVNGVNYLGTAALAGQSTTVVAVMSASVYSNKTGKRVLVVTGQGESTSGSGGAGYKGIVFTKQASSVTEQSVYNAINKAIEELAKKINSMV